MKKARKIMATCWMSVLLVASAAAQESQDAGRRSPAFGGPDAVENQLRSDAEVERPSLFKSWFEWKGGLAERSDFSFSIDYSAAYLEADQSPGEESSAGGMFRFFGSWDLVGRGTKNTGAIIWKVEHRHAYTDVPPSGFGFNLGYIGLIEPPFSDQGTRLTNLYWRQRLADGRVTLLGGFLDATDYVDVYALASPWTGFLNFAFSTGTTTLAVPNDAAFGFAAGAMLSDSVFLIGSLSDLNSDPTDPSKTVNSFFSDNEYFKSVEIGWTTSQDRIYLDNVHLTLWHVDEMAEVGTPSGWGANFSYTTYINGKWMPFVRAGYASDGGSLMQKSVSVGFGYQPNPSKNLLGVGLNWGEPNEKTWEPGLDDQYTAELFYRWQVSKAIALTPNLQYLKDPANNQDEDSIWVVGVRLRGVL
ncbi:MAG: carbohydrate porin [bacterium]|nr:carbohydrate porin [bacterium]